MLRTWARLAVAVVLAVTVASVMAVGPPPQARAALVAVAMPDSLTMKHDRTAVVPAPGVLGNDLYLLGGATAVLVSGVTHGTLSLQSNGGYTYTPSAGYIGSDSFRYRPSGALLSTTVTITITNAAPVARPDAYSGMAGTTLVVAAPGVLANDSDADGDALSAAQVGGVTGSLNLHPNGGFEYTPGGGFSGTATFSYRVWDGVTWSGTTTVTLTIVAPTPSPSPTPRPTPSPTPRPTPSPTPSPSLPLPSLPLPSLPLPTIPLPTPSPSVPTLPLPTATPTPVPWPTLPLPSIGLPGSPSPSPSGDPSGSSPQPSSNSDASASPAAPETGGGGTTSGSGTGPSGPSSGGPNAALGQVRLQAPGPGLGVETLGVLAGVETWIVPAAAIAGPGFIVLLWILLQAAGAMAWIPAARRLRDGDVSRVRR
jgi:hypothetical protein